MNIPSTSANTDLWRAVFFDGPHSDRNYDGDEFPVSCVYVGDKEVEPIHRSALTGPLGDSMKFG